MLEVNTSSSNYGYGAHHWNNTSITTQINSYQRIFEGSLLDDPNEYRHKEPPNAAANSSTFLAARWNSISIRDATQCTGKLKTRIILVRWGTTLRQSSRNSSHLMKKFHLGQQNYINQSTIPAVISLPLWCNVYKPTPPDALERYLGGIDVKLSKSLLLQEHRTCSLSLWCT